MKFELHFVPGAIVLMVLLGFAYIFLKENKGRAKNAIWSLFANIWVALFFFYLSWILMGTFFGRDVFNPYEKVFEGFGIIVDGKLNRDAIKNILVFIPLIFFNLNAFPTSKPFRRAIRLSVLLTCIIEGLQLLFWLGNFQLSDIIHNIWGGIIGYFVWWILRKMNETIVHKSK